MGGGPRISTPYSAAILAGAAGSTGPGSGRRRDLERLGYVTRQTDPSDRRAKLVVPTPRAREVTTLVQQVNDAIEHHLRRELGDHAYAALRQALAALVPRQRQLIQPRIHPPGPR